MHVLISAYACEPGAGSELGKGWNFACELARQGCDVVVLTCGSHHRGSIERYRDQHGLPRGLSFAWHDVPGWRGSGYAQAHYIRQHYIAWQMTARKLVTRLNAERPFDVIHHLTWTVLRWPSFLGGLGPRFVFGPVGGGQSAPWRLRHGFPRRGWKVEIQRDLLNLWSRVDPMVLGCLRRADVILVTDEATRRHVPDRWHDKVFKVPDIYAPPCSPRAEPARTDPNKPQAILFAGRLEYWKAPHLVLGAISKLRQRCFRFSCTIAGAGPEEAFLHSLAAELDVEDLVRFVGHVPHADMQKLYAAHDIFLFPSLHDSAGQAIGEAFAHGLPVVCLDLGGPGVAVDESCGIVLSTAGRDRPAVELGLADALARIIEGRALLARLSAGAKRRAQQLSYPQRVRDIAERFYRIERETSLLSHK